MFFPTSQERVDIDNGSYLERERERKRDQIDNLNFFEKAFQEPGASIVTNYVFDKTGNEQKSWKFCTDVSVSKSEVLFMSQLTFILV